MDTAYYKILKKLQPEGIGVQVDISPTLLETYSNVDPMDHEKVKYYSGIIRRVIRAMVESGLIKAEEPSIGGGNTSTGYRWIDKTPLHASITDKGISAIDAEVSKGSEQRLQESMIEVNKSIIETNFATRANFTLQVKFANRSLWLAAASSLFIFITVLFQFLDKTPQNLQDIKIELQTSSNKLDSLQNSLEKINTTLKYLADSLTKNEYK